MKFRKRSTVLLWAVVVAQLVEQLLPELKVRGSKPIEQLL